MRNGPKKIFEMVRNTCVNTPNKTGSKYTYYYESSDIELYYSISGDEQKVKIIYEGNHFDIHVRNGHLVNHSKFDDSVVKGIYECLPVEALL